MDIVEAIQARHSVRAYRLELVPKQIPTEIMEVALRAPSWGNTQT